MKNSHKKYLILFAFFGFIEIIAEYFLWQPIIIIVKPILPLLLLISYKIEFKNCDVFFSLILITSSITNLLFIWVDSLFIYGVTIFTIHRILMIIFLIRIFEMKDFLPLLLATIPFLMFSAYIFFDVIFKTQTIEYFIFTQNTLISFLGGMALSQYILKDSSKITWLMLSIFLFFCLHFLVYIELFYVRYPFMRSLAMLLNICAFYTFYRFVVVNNSEKLSTN